MYIKSFFTGFVLVAVFANALPTIETPQPQSNGFGSTIWSWIAYPITWWYQSDDKNIHEANNKLDNINSSALNYFIDLGKPNLTIWCNDQTCTNVRCQSDGSCYTATCHIYDTDKSGECRFYNKTIKTTTLLPEISTLIQIPNGLVEKPLAIEEALDKFGGQIEDANGNNPAPIEVDTNIEEKAINESKTISH